jgi:flagellar transcriptional activator FlhD
MPNEHTPVRSPGAVAPSDSPSIKDEAEEEARWLEEIREANLSFLILAQSMIRRDMQRAIFRLGISEPVARIVGELTPGQILRVASTNMVMFRLRFDDQMIWSLLSDHGKGSETEPRTDAVAGSASIATATDTSRASGLSAGTDAARRLHASILMARNYEEAIE